MDAFNRPDEIPNQVMWNPMNTPEQIKNISYNQYHHRKYWT